MTYLRSNYPTTIDKLKTLPIYQDMTIEDKRMVGRYQVLIEKNNLTSDEQLELSSLVERLRDKMINSEDWNQLIGAVLNLETYFKDNVLDHIDNKLSGLNTIAANTVNTVEKAKNDAIANMDSVKSTTINAVNQIGNETTAEIENTKDGAISEISIIKNEATQSIATSLNQANDVFTEMKRIEGDFKTDLPILNDCVERIEQADEQIKRLQDASNSVQDDIAKIESVGNKEILIRTSEWTLNGDVYEKEITHNLYSENLHVTAKNSDTKEAVTIGYKILDKTRILLKSDEAIPLSLILSASFYNPIITSNVDEGEIVRARKGESGLDVKIAKIDEQLDTITYLITSDLTQIQVKNILETKKNIKVTEGIYDFDTVLTLMDNVNIVFEKNAKLNYIGSELVAIKLGNNSTLTNFNLISKNKIKNSYGVQANGKSNINIIGGTIDGFGFANIGIVSCKNVSIQGVNSINCGNKADGSEWYGQGVWVNTSEDVIINGNNIKDNGMHGIQVMTSRNVIVTDNICNENGDCGITINTTDIFKISDNICDHNGVNGGAYGGQGIQVVGNSTTNSKDGTITGNTCRNNLENGIEVTTYCEDITIDDNVSKYNNWAGIAVNPNCDTVAVGNNICKYNQNGISCKNSKVLQLTGNITNNNKENGVNISGCEIANVDNFISLNNGQGYNDRCGVLVTGGSDVDVKNGKAFDTQDNKTQAYGVRYYSSSGICINNRLKGNKTKSFDTTSSTVISDNLDDDDITTSGRKDLNGVSWKSGNGSPNGRVWANKGSIYLRSDGEDANSIIYLKTTDRSNSGWVVK